MRSRVLMLLVALMVLFAPAGHSLMQIIGPDGYMGVSADWPEVLKELVRTDARVLGVEGPIIDVRIYCAGDTAKLNAFLKDYAKVPDARLKVVLHPGRETCIYRRPVFGPDGKMRGEEEQIFDVDWKLHVGDYANFRHDAAAFEGKKFLTTLDIWLGGQIDFDKLDVPPSLHVTSSGELDEFIDRHEKERKQQDDN